MARRDMARNTNNNGTRWKHVIVTWRQKKTEFKLRVQAISQQEVAERQRTNTRSKG